MSSDIPPIQAEGEFVHVAAQMLLAHVVVDAVHPALHHRPNALDAVRAHAVAGVFPGAVVHALMAERLAIKPDVAGVLVREDRGTCLYVGMDGGLQRGCVRAFQRHRNRAPAAFPHPHDSTLADAATPCPQFLVFVLVGFLPSDEHFVNFNHALQLLQLASARLPQPMQDEPCGLLCDSDFLRQLERTDALAGGHKQVHRIKPFVQRNMRPLEDRSRADREVQLAGIAAVESALAGGDPLADFAGRADDAIHPETGLKVKTGGFLVGEHLEQLEGTDCAFAHVHIVLYSPKGVKYFVVSAEIIPCYVIENTVYILFQ